MGGCNKRIAVTISEIDNIVSYFCHKEASLTGQSTTLEKKRFQDFLNSMDPTLNSIQGHSAILYLKKEAVGL